MPTSLNKYLDPAALDETVVNIRELVEGLEAEMQNLPYARPDGIYPDMTVGAVIGADETAQWITRESTGSGAATVRSVQGASVVWNQLSKNDGVSNTTGLTRTFNANGSVTIDGTSNAKGEFVIGDGVQLYKDHKYLVKGCPAGGSSTTYYMGISVFVIDTGAGGIWTSGSSAISHFKFFVKSEQTFSNVTFYPQLFDLTAMFGSGNEPTTVAEFEQMFPAAYYPYSAPTLKPVQIAGIRSTDAQGGELDAIEWPTQTLRAAGSVADELTSDELVTRVGVRTYQSGDESDPTVRTDGTTTYYPLATPTTTPISPALPMTYRVQAGGSESIIVPDGEVSAAPVLTVAEPVNAGDEFARIWAAIESLGYTRNVAQLSRPVSLTDIGSIDEVKIDTTEIDTTEIDTTKEVTE